MDFVSILALSVGLAMDATAVAAARGLAAQHITPASALRVAVLFGGFQALMPLLGWTIGRHFGPRFAAWDHWIAFGLLGGLGAKMIYDAVTKRDADAAPRPDEAFQWRALLGLAVATSVDAFAVGVTLPLLRAPLAVSLATIGITTAVLSAAGVYAGRRLGAALGRRLDALGGVILVLLGVRTLLTHLSGRA